MAYEKPEYTIVGEATDVVLGEIKNVVGNDDVDQDSTDPNLPLGLED